MESTSSTERLEREALRAEKHGLQCGNCQSKRVLSLLAKGKDTFLITWPWGYEQEGYAPYIPGLCGGDNVDLDLCVDCGHLIGFDKEAMQEAMEEAGQQEESDG